MSYFDDLAEYIRDTHRTTTAERQKAGLPIPKTVLVDANIADEVLEILRNNSPRWLVYVRRDDIVDACTIDFPKLRDGT